METRNEMYGTSGYGVSGTDPLAWMAANQTADLRRDVAKSEADLSKQIGEAECRILSEVGDAECGILSKVGEAECTLLKSQADIAHRNTIHLNSVERDLQNRILENRQISTKELNDVERSLSEKLCDIKADAKDNTRLILDRLYADKLDEKNEIIESLRHERSHDRHAHAFALQNQELSYLKQMINSVEQTQKFSSKTVQFGAGNVAIPTQTANQA